MESRRVWTQEPLRLTLRHGVIVGGKQNQRKQRGITDCKARTCRLYPFRLHNFLPTYKRSQRNAKTRGEENEWDLAIFNNTHSNRKYIEPRMLYNGMKYRIFISYEAINKPADEMCSK